MYYFEKMNIKIWENLDSEMFKKKKFENLNNFHQFEENHTDQKNIP